MAYPPAVEQWRPLVAKYFPANLVDKALHVIMYESSGNPNAVGDGGAARGLFQIQDSRNFSSRPSAAYLDNAENNIRYAAQELGAASGKWTDWGEGSSYNGQPFGALGNHPYEGGGGSSDGTPLGGRAQTSAGITFGGTTQPRNTYGIYDNLNSGSGNNGGRNLSTQSSSPGGTPRPPTFSSGFGGGGGSNGAGIGVTVGGGVETGGYTPDPNAGASGSYDPVKNLMDLYGITREQALQMLDIDSGSASDDYIPPDHFFDISPGDERDFAESVWRDRRDFDYNASQDSADRLLVEAAAKAKASQQAFDNAMAVGDFQAAQQAAQQKQHWDTVAATQENARINLTGQGQQLDYNLGLGQIAADRYGTDASLALGNAQNATTAALGQQSNQTSQFGAETARLDSERDYILGMANATTDAERAATEEKRRQDMVAIANMEGRNQLTLGQQANTNDAFANDTQRQAGNQNYYAALANAANDAARIGVDDAGRVDRNSQFNAGETNDMTLGQQQNRTAQFGAETDRANRMGELGLKQNQFILDAAGQPRNMFSLYMMQRGLAPDWETLGNGGQVAQGAALAPVDVMNAYTPVTTPGTFDATAAQSTAAQGVGAGWGVDDNYFLKNFADANTATTSVPTHNAQFQAAQGQAGSSYNAAANPFIGKQASYTPTTSAPTFNYTPDKAVAGAWTGPEAVNSFLPNQGPVAPPPPLYQDTNPGGLQNGVALSGLRPGLNLSTVGGADRTGSSFSLPSYYDQGMTRPIGPDDIVQGGTQVWTMYQPGGGQPAPAADPHAGGPGVGPGSIQNFVIPQQPNPNMTPQLTIPQVARYASGGLTRAPQFITGDDPTKAGGLGENAELNEPIVDGDGRYQGTRITPLNPNRRPLGNAWGGDNLAMAAGFGLRPHTVFSKR
ncbi:MAG: transglycosylase SLT domain-containing protein [Candidatus Paceibacterota bacterium]